MLAQENGWPDSEFLAYKKIRGETKPDTRLASRWQEVFRGWEVDETQPPIAMVRRRRPGLSCNCNNARRFGATSRIMRDGRGLQKNSAGKSKWAFVST